ncbi:MAG: sensor hybrid histidine kinase [Rhizobacter sp.]|nr:sensor hybrid histidine kinase [Rhizobacter sp.]
MTQSIALNVQALSSFELAVLRFTPQGVCSFANLAADRLLGEGHPGAVGLTLDQLFPGAIERGAVADELGKRLAGHASSYRTKFTRPGTAEVVPISVFAFPVLDSNGGIAGTMAIVRDLREERVAAAIHEAVETLRTDQHMLAAVAVELRRLIDFDDFRVVAISRGRHHLRTIYTTDDAAERRYPFKWWPVPPFLLDTLDTEVAKTMDIRRMFEEPRYAEMARQDVGARAFLESGMRHSLSLPIVQGDRIVAFVALDTRSARPYDAADIALCDRLPLSQAVLMALHFEEEARLHACVDLIRELGARSLDVKSVAATLTERLAAHFGWDHVAVFQHDEDDHTFKLLSQSSSSGRKMDDGVTLPNDSGIVAAAFARQAEINVPDIASSRQRVVAGEPSYIEGVSGMASELAMPIPGDTPRWVLNVESRLGLAFAEEEIDTLRLVTVEAGHILERSALLELRDAILHSINDAVIETDRRGTIRRANPAAERILASTQAKLSGQSLAAFIADAAIGEAIASADSFSRREVEIRSSEGRSVWALLSGATLPENLGGKVFVASDLTYEREVQRIGALKDVFRNASLESRTPLSLAAGWLGQLATVEPTTASIVERVLKQMRKADLPLERLLRLATPDAAREALLAPIDLRMVVAEVLDDLPESDQQSISVAPSPRPAMVRASRAGLHFCFESALSFALRTRPQDRQIQVAVTMTATRAAISLVGEWAPDLGEDQESGIRQRWRRQTLTDLALAADEIDAILARASGRFRSQLDERLMFEMELPLAAAQ